MAHDAARARVAARLAALRSADERLARSLDAAISRVGAIPESAIDRERLVAVTTAIGALREPLAADLIALEAAGDPPSGPGPGDQLHRSGSLDGASDAIQAAYAAVSEASGAAAALFTTARLMFEGSVCNFAASRMQTYADVTRAFDAMLPQIVGWELRNEGLACHCECPMCGIGACGCIWASIHSIDLAAGGPGLLDPDERGVALRSPPRPDSPLAAADVQQWDRVVAVDDELVRTPVELQGALRKHAVGDEIRLRLNRDGEARNITVPLASDWAPPS